MTTRAADATIKGYYYQFDTSILQLLALKTNADSITVEGIEDIDIETATSATTIQCKYLSKPKFINSSVREPIILMLDHFINPATPSNYNYILYAHFENEKPGSEPKIDLSRLKDILTFTKKKIEKHYGTEKGISDLQLNAFIKQFKLVFGKEFYTQQREVISKLKGKFNCSDFEADTLYYNNSLRLIIDKAIKKNVNQRVITKGDFLKGIDCSKKLFNEWFIKLRSKKECLTLTAQNLKSTRALDPIKTKFIVIGEEILDADNSSLPIQPFIEDLINKYYRINSALRDAKPLTIILDCKESTLTSLKKSLIIREIFFNDGYEDISFSTTYFNREPVVNTTSNGTKIAKSSYYFRLISLSTLLANSSTITEPKVFLNFTKKDIPYALATAQFFDIKYCENLKDIYKLLVP